MLIQKKVALQKAGKSVKRYLHKDPSDLTDEEYQRRKKVLRFWFEYPKKWTEWAQSVFDEKKKRSREEQEPGPGEVWAVAFIRKGGKLSIGQNLQFDDKDEQKK